ncbi:TonB-dependent receptor [Tsuneonella sp. CC-YZS046]|uniref:TonB-dependent receptor n=1 Tax=Tsuneonella sp. CC-YZS046 TaxID=3042152 RepID=UPI002D76E4E0|nr:TonB-dependent receptor [Tsuneonella sp. CC-YZS046]WRO65187.1 TonB-dependent receptor [Tsuneonella sp. CC-YZS046]
MRHFKTLALYAGCATTALLGSALPAFAQDSDTQRGAGEIVVTATKREQSLNDVGISVAAISGAQLQAQRVADVSDLAKITPGLTFAPTPNATPVYTLRGVGFYDSSLASYPDVSLYLDQVPLSLPVMSSKTAFDLERVEVLKGPQGTLFGNNATGGAINFVAAKPTNDFEAGASFSYGRFNTIETDGFISGPITEGVKARLAVRAENGDGWQKSYTRDDSNGKRDNIAGRLLIDIEPTSDLKISLNVNGWRDQDDPQAPQRIAYTPQNDVSGAPVSNVFTPSPGGPVPFAQASYPNAPRNARAADWTPEYAPEQDNKFWQASGRIDYDFGGITLTSLTGYSELDFQNTTEGGGTALVDLDLRDDSGKIKSFTQEVRLSNDASNRLRFTIGANYEKTSVYEKTYLAYRDTSSTYVNGITVSSYWSDQDMKNYAAFGNLEFDVTDQITLKGGIRQTKAKRKAHSFNGDMPEYPITPQDVTFVGTPGVTLTNFFNALYGVIGPIYGGPSYAIPTITSGGSIILDTRGVNLADPSQSTPVDPSTFLTAAPVDVSLNENSTSWMLGADFKPNDDLLLYVNVSKGYKAGSAPHVSGSIFDAYSTVKQESILAYEAGFKADLADRKISLTGAGFYYDYKNKQTRAKFVDPIFGALDRLLNVPKSKIWGAELQLDARPVPGLTLSASATYLNAKVKKYEGAIGIESIEGLLFPVNASFKNVRLPYAPKLQYSARADYEFDLNSNLVGLLGVGVNGQTKSYSALVVQGSDLFGAPSDLYDINARTLVNANIGVGSSDGKWRVTVWGENIFNKYYWVNATQAYDTFVRYTGRPAEYGVTVGLKF